MKITLLIFILSVGSYAAWMSAADLQKFHDDTFPRRIWERKSRCEANSSPCARLGNRDPDVSVMDADDPATINSEACTPTSQPLTVANCVVIVGGNQSLGVTAKTCPNFYNVESDFLTTASCESVGPHLVLDQAKKDAKIAAAAAEAAAKADRITELKDLSDATTLVQVRAKLGKLIKHLGIK